MLVKKGKVCYDESINSGKERSFMMKKLLCCLAALILLLSTAALADVTVVTPQRSPYLSTATGCYYMSVGGGFQLFDAYGNALSAVYGDMSAKQNGRYYTYYGNGLNSIGLLDAQGQVLCQPSYGHVYFLDDNWGLAYVLQTTSADTGDFKDSSNNKYMAVRTDVLYQGHVVLSLNRAEYDPSWAEGTCGRWLYLKKSADEGMYIAPDGTVTKVTAEMSISEFSDLGKKGIRHNPTQQMAFCAGCTLTQADVDTWVWFDSAKDVLLDLQGNVIKSGLMYDSIKQHGDYLLIRHAGCYGIMDLAGNVIAEPVYKDISYSDGLFSNGYQAVLTKNGCLQYLDTKGNVVASVDYELSSSSDYKGFNYNAPFAVVNNMGKYIVITRECGELPTRYDDVQTPKTNQSILAVQKDGLWGAIDLRGNTVIPFVNTNLTLSSDGTVASGRNELYINQIYIITPDAAPAATPVPAAAAVADDAWACSCGAQNTGKFCTECGSAKPVPTPTPDDGSWTCSCGSVNTGKFCPECGSPKPVEQAEPQCSSCGYKPEGDAPKFCPECGAKF